LTVSSKSALQTRSKRQFANNLNVPFNMSDVKLAELRNRLLLPPVHGANPVRNFQLSMNIIVGRQFVTVLRIAFTALSDFNTSFGILMHNSPMALDNDCRGTKPCCDVLRWLQTFRMTSQNQIFVHRYPFRYISLKLP
jgi:hypothetical protein